MKVYVVMVGVGCLGVTVELDKAQALAQKDNEVPADWEHSQLRWEPSGEGCWMAENRLYGDYYIIKLMEVQ